MNNGNIEKKKILKWLSLLLSRALKYTIWSVILFTKASVDGLRETIFKTKMDHKKGSVDGLRESELGRKSRPDFSRASCRPTKTKKSKTMKK